MSGHSPFAPATPVAPSAPPGPSFAANWFVTGIARIDDKDFVSIQARDLSTQFSLLGHDPHPGNEVSLVEVQWSPVIGKSTVTLRKGAEIASLEFNEATIRGPTKQATAAAGTATTGQGKQPLPMAGIQPGQLRMPNSAPITVASFATPAPTGQTPDKAVANIRRRMRPVDGPQN
jgi:hypothetical protein